MKINQNVTFLKNAADSPAVPTRDGVKPNRAVSGMPAEAAQTRPAAATPLLPSTNGDFDAARVGKIREDISAGRYHVDTAKIADGLLRSVRDLLGEKAP
ncbi:MAG: flagellar biosynthesis anti-sigma factor FlgM [Polaromonas sp.]|uniref:flagellar biosynthesis anti-sigma factor FlgM n=1 Tax=Polaromonas sp. TaxID=1869339 RepID=UPI0027316F6D|nr:flagellar biosynthesis anti-sigma factor FlgM [Polaromonas sp.]MDP2448807.1 flagellar biosynthesis anti-sigma factor FlgM [Polaromonas sp.]MDP3247069.1 flagellar biosynthesis anti-sigma factor FlgM [Polaromonas sp.]MDP3754858.1 flagellar biosynthesis anti-sigma factor FlgM [Polaromonas sp.]MDP3826071.1 flagellar biosynthesis anti-sigma factor FlgM [Polaromonas sp.]